jgi:hypothetical protein
MHPLAVAQVLTLLLLVNSAPAVAKKILGDRFAWPLDFGIELPDGHRLFGASKTIHGVALAVFSGWAGWLAICCRAFSSGGSTYPRAARRSASIRSRNRCSHSSSALTRLT